MTFPKTQAAAAAFGLAAILPLAATAATLDTRLIASGLSQPLYATSPVAGGPVFVLEKGGTIKAVSGGVSSNFLSIGVTSSGEQGLLGLAFDPGYADPASAGFRRFFVNYSDPSNQDTVIASYRANANGLTADPASRVEVIRIDQPSFNNHKAGWIGFKPGDANNLYIATGDGGSGNDPLNNAQNTNVLLGKMLRININGDDFASPTINYAVPTDNPFVGVAGTRGEIFATGLRNPWRSSFDRLTGALWIADVGQGQREEINFIDAASPGGQNFGWRLREGDIATPGGVGGPLQPGMVDPMLVYPRSFGASITGGYVVRDTSSVLYGQYIFGDFVSGRIWTINGDGSAQTMANATDLTAVLDSGAAGALVSIASFGEGPGGEIFIVDFGGKVVQVVPEPASVLMMLSGAMALLLWRRRSAAQARRD